MLLLLPLSLLALFLCHRAAEGADVAAAAVAIRGATGLLLLFRRRLPHHERRLITSFDE